MGEDDNIMLAEARWAEDASRLSVKRALGATGLPIARGNRGLYEIDKIAA